MLLNDGHVLQQLLEVGGGGGSTILPGGGSLVVAVGWRIVGLGGGALLPLDAGLGAGLGRRWL